SVVETAKQRQMARAERRMWGWGRAAAGLYSRGWVMGVFKYEVRRAQCEMGTVLVYGDVGFHDFAEDYGSVAAAGEGEGELEVGAVVVGVGIDLDVGGEEA